jgi:hypothetical protein
MTENGERLFFQKDYRLVCEYRTIKGLACCGIRERQHEHNVQKLADEGGSNPQSPR